MKNSQKGFVVPLVIAIIAVLAIGGGVYVYKNKKVETDTEIQQTTTPLAQTDNQTTVTPTNSNSNQQPLVNTDLKVTLGPKETYLKIKLEFDKIQTFSDFYNLSLKYGTKNNIAKIQAQKSQIDALPQEFKEGLVTQMKTIMPTSSEITTIKVTTNGNNSTLKVSSTKPGTEGTVLMVYENNEWKLDNESWKQK